MLHGKILTSCVVVVVGMVLFAILLFILVPLLWPGVFMIVIMVVLVWVPFWVLLETLAVVVLSSLMTRPLVLLLPIRSRILRPHVLMRMDLLLEMGRWSGRRVVFPSCMVGACLPVHGARRAAMIIIRNDLTLPFSPVRRSFYVWVAPLLRRRGICIVRFVVSMETP